MLDVSIKLNVFIHENINHIHNYVKKPIEFIPFRLKSCLGYCLALLQSFGKFADIRLAYKKRASANLTQIAVIFLQAEL